MIRFTFTDVATRHMERNSVTPSQLLGNIPHFLSADDPASAVEQIDRAYRRVGGGWHDMKGHTLSVERGTLRYPGDPARQLIARATLREEQVLFFDGAWIAVVQPDTSFRVARID